MNWENLKNKPDQLLIDGPYSDIQLISVENIIQGDSKSQSIAAASIIAKVKRDRIMREYDYIYPEYKFIKNKGYGTKLHIELIKLHIADALFKIFSLWFFLIDPLNVKGSLWKYISIFLFGTFSIK